MTVFELTKQLAKLPSDDEIRVIGKRERDGGFATHDFNLKGLPKPDGTRVWLIMSVFENDSDAIDFFLK